MTARLFPHDDPAHLHAVELLPWFANDSLEDFERATIETHLNECLACTQELADLRKLRAALLEHDPAVAAGLARIHARLDQTVSARGWRARLMALSDQWGRTPPWMRGAVVAQMMLIVALGSVAYSALTVESLRSYHVLGAAVTSQPRFGEIVVIFDSRSSLSEVQKSIVNVSGKLVDGPAADGTYTIRVPLAEFDAALDRLQHDRAITFAQPVVR